ncbi:MAG: site-2 protease family protein [Candidatus Aenigmatarchaeota archaeon]|nr:site-2 protease family protein [Candidatus Aenigmarchaeota archaeon]
METFTKEEIRDIIVSVIALIIIFSWKPFPRFGLNLDLIPYFIVIILVAFLLHEMAHKWMARKFNMAAHYKMWPQGILFGLIFMILGLKFVAPGAVVVYPYRFARWGFRRPYPEIASGEMGLIALAGPVTNLFSALLFSLFDSFLFNQLKFINAWLAFFNLLPVPPLDGSKVLIWKPWIWGMCIAVALILVFI